MKKELLDILACPIDRTHPLELLELITNDGEIVEGLMICPQCDRFFPIIDEIPIMLPDELREKEKEMSFLRKHRSKLPDRIINRLKPWRP